MLRRVLLSLCLLTMSVAGLTITNATPASAGLSPLAERKCMNFDSSNNRRLSICARGWVPDDGAYQWRGVVEMHTYIWVAGRAPSFCRYVGFIRGRSRGWRGVGVGCGRVGVARRRG
jgi:hypothetical protein